MLPHNLITGYLGIDIGTQGLSVTFTDQDLSVIGTGEASYDFVNGLDNGCYEQRCEDWDQAIHMAMKSLRKTIEPNTISVLCIGISGQMHGEVLVNEAGEPLQPVRLWCDARNDGEGHELTNAFGCKVPKRATVARFLWTIRNRYSIAAQTAHVTTPAGWMAYCLTGQFTLGIGDAAGMFPIDATTQQYDHEKMEIFDRLVNHSEIPSLKQLLPQICKAGDAAGFLTEKGATLLGIDHIGIPVAAAEGDQVAALAGSLIGNAGTVSCCFGTSVCANVVGDRTFTGVHPAVDHFCAADGKPINMVWLRNGTTFLNTIVQSYSWNNEHDEACTKTDSFSKIMNELVQAQNDCGGLLALPFMDDEPGLEVSSGGSALILGWNPSNASVGNVAKAALLSSMFNLRIGCNVLRDQGFPIDEIVLTGGLSKTKECGQILCDVFNTPVILLSSAEEGCAWGAAIMAKYCNIRVNDLDFDKDWASFLKSISTSVTKQRFVPDHETVAIYDEMFRRYKNMVSLVPAIELASTIP